MSNQLILVVEDDADVREAIVSALEREGFAVIAATDGSRALQLLHHGIRPHVIVLDLMMPVMDGWEFRRHQLADSALASIPVIVLSAHPEALGLVDDPGLNAVLIKPVDFETLLASLESASKR